MANTATSRMEQSDSSSQSHGLGPKKTLIIMVIIVGCIAVLWPKIFYPMLISSGHNKNNVIKDHRPGGCCDVVLDEKETYPNSTLSLIEQNQNFRKRLHVISEEISIRQERPPHLRNEAIHPAMRERGRAIPTPTVPITGHMPPIPPKVIDGRPGPIPGMRPPMGAGSHQSQQKATSMGFIMPLYTIGIVSFFIYTILKLVFKKTQNNSPYDDIKSDPMFRNEVFNQDTPYIKRPDDGTTKLGLINAADEQLMKIEKEKETANHLSKETNENNLNGDIIKANGHTKAIDEKANYGDDVNEENTTTAKIDKDEEENIKNKKNLESSDKEKGTVKVLGMEMTATCEGGKKWSRPNTPTVLQSPLSSSNLDDVEKPEPQSIYLEGALPHESQILVSDSETTTECFVDDDDDWLGSENDPAVILSGKMTLSLINLDHIEKDAIAMSVSDATTLENGDVKHPENEKIATNLTVNEE
uniref:Putative receptor associated protein ric-3 n=1 Tax=Corethrella appendiculata TaxID=1370023 RepID=U5EU34_9DIPT